jgi:RNA polymerase sigma-70 factor (ECF subfamily)
MLGSVSEAEDVVQEGLLRLHRARDGGERIESPRAYLSTVVSRLSLDYLRSARVRRETYVGEWLPEPLVASADDDPARKLEMADSWSLAFLVLLESLSPEQRAAFLLRDALLRGRRGGRSRRPRATVGPRRGAPRRRRRQGAGHQRALHGRAKVARTLIAGLRAGARLGGFTLRREEVNGQPGALVIDRDGRLAGVMVLDVADGQIQAVSSIVNPDKLQHLGPLADLRALRRERS